MCLIFNFAQQLCGLLHKCITGVLVCLLSLSICCVMLFAIIAGVALGYNYSVSEYIANKDTNVSVQLQRGIFPERTDGDLGTRRRAGAGPAEREDDDKKTLKQRLRLLESAEDYEKSLHDLTSENNKLGLATPAADKFAYGEGVKIDDEFSYKTTFDKFLNPQYGKPVNSEYSTSGILGSPKSQNLEEGSTIKFQDELSKVKKEELLRNLIHQLKLASPLDVAKLLTAEMGSTTAVEDIGMKFHTEHTNKYYLHSMDTTTNIRKSDTSGHEFRQTFAPTGSQLDLVKSQTMDKTTLNSQTRRNFESKAEIESRKYLKNEKKTNDTSTNINNLMEQTSKAIVLTNKKQTADPNLELESDFVDSHDLSDDEILEALNRNEAAELRNGFMQTKNKASDSNNNKRKISQRDVRTNKTSSFNDSRMDLSQFLELIKKFVPLPYAVANDSVKTSNAPSTEIGSGNDLSDRSKALEAEGWKRVEDLGDGSGDSVTPTSADYDDDDDGENPRNYERVK